MFTDGDAHDKQEILNLLCSALGMTEAELQACQGKTLLSTARQVIAAKYPAELATFSDVSKEHLQAAAGELLSYG